MCYIRLIMRAINEKIWANVLFIFSLNYQYLIAHGVTSLCNQVGSNFSMVIFFNKNHPFFIIMSIFLYYLKL